MILTPACNTSNWTASSWRLSLVKDNAVERSGLVCILVKTCSHSPDRCRAQDVYILVRSCFLQSYQCERTHVFPNTSQDVQDPRRQIMEVIWSQLHKCRSYIYKIIYDLSTRFLQTRLPSRARSSIYIHDVQHYSVSTFPYFNLFARLWGKAITEAQNILRLCAAHLTRLKSMRAWASITFLIQFVWQTDLCRRRAYFSCNLKQWKCRGTSISASLTRLAHRSYIQGSSARRAHFHWTGSSKRSLQTIISSLLPRWRQCSNPFSF